MQLPILSITVLAGILIAGCSTDHEPIVFLSDPKTPLRPAEPPPKLPPSLSSAEQAQVARQVLTKLLQTHFGDDGDYSAIFLQATEAQTTDLMNAFPQHEPPIKQLWHADVRPGFAPVDKDTGRPALIFSVEEMDPENGRVTAIGRWYAGDTVKGYYTYQLVKTTSGWTVQSPE